MTVDDPSDGSPECAEDGIGPDSTSSQASRGAKTSTPASASTPRGFSASPYTTGGGGTVLEHTLGARVLVALLTGSPAPLLGEDVAVTSVMFQRSDISPLDDLVVLGETGDGSTRRVAVGVRRAPAFNTSDRDTEALLRSYLKVLFERWDDVANGSCRLGLAVASLSTPANELKSLAEIASAARDAAGFRVDVAAANRTTDHTRKRLVHLDALVAASRAGNGPDDRSESDREVTYALLCGLRVHWMQSEGVADSDRAVAVGAIGPHLVDPANAASVFGRLERLSATYASSATWATPAKLRRDLHGFGVGPGRSYQRASGVLTSLAQSLHNRTRFGLTQPGASALELPRMVLREALMEAVREASERDVCLVVHGDPDVGKSALALRAMEDLRDDGATVTALSLRDVPDNFIAFELALRARFASMLSDAPTGHPRVLLIDGAEAALEGRADMLRDLSSAAAEAGHTVVAVSRNDARSAVSEALGAGSPGKPDVFPIEGLDATETGQVVEAFKVLSSVLATRHASWIAARPGLLDLLLQAGPVTAPRTRSMCEADVLVAVWENLVRDSERAAVGAPGPDARDQTMVAFARQRLAGGSPASGSGSVSGVDLPALPSLRSDGLLVSSGGLGWLHGDDFASDLLADMALAVMLHRDGFTALDGPGAPRWTIRAARMAAQLMLTTAADPVTAWSTLLTTFGTLAATHGNRWSEIPFEALLTIPGADELLDALWATLLAAPEGAGSIDNAIRLAIQTHTTKFKEGIEVSAEGIDQVGPWVRRLFVDGDHGQHNPHSRGQAERIRDLTLAWLRGVSSYDETHPVRVAVRDAILAAEPTRHDKFAMEAFGLLGDDTNGDTRGHIETEIAAGGSRLLAAVESPWVAHSLSRNDPDLLLRMANAYYIPLPKKAGPFGSYSSRNSRDAIRPHRNRLNGYQPRYASYAHGPFFDLLRIQPRQTLALINKILDVAARARTDNTHQALTGPWGDDRPAGFEIELPDFGVRLCYGDGQTWGWYRGMGTGPYPCMSALLAVEVCAERLIEAGLGTDVVARMLLRDCNNLAMPGLVVGLLTRHADKTPDALIPWLGDPLIWDLESARALQEKVGIVARYDHPELHGENARHLHLQQLVAMLIVRATQAKDEEALDNLRALGEKFLAVAALRNTGDGHALTSATEDTTNSEATPVAIGDQEAHKVPSDERTDEQTDPAIEEGVGGDDGASSTEDIDEVTESLNVATLTHRRWAGMFDSTNYAFSAEGGATYFGFEEPADITAELSPISEAIARNSTATRLQATYAYHDQRDNIAATLAHDLEAAKALLRQVQNPESDDQNDVDSDRDERFAIDAAAAVAATAIVASSQDRLTLTTDQRTWAINLLIDEAIDVHQGLYDYDRSIHPSAADRSAAAALPLALAAPDVTTYLDRIELSRFIQALQSCANSLYNEVRAFYATAAETLWAVTCSSLVKGEACRHRLVWDTLLTVLDQAGRAYPEGPYGEVISTAIPAPVAQTLTTADPNTFDFALLAPLLKTSAVAAHSESCVRTHAATLSSALLTAGVRSLIKQAEQNYDVDDAEPAAIAETLLASAVADHNTDGPHEVLRASVRTLTASSRALDAVLRSVTSTLTYDLVYTEHLLPIARTVLETVLDAVDADPTLLKGDWSNWAISAVLLTPGIRPQDRSPDNTLDTATDRWFKPDDLGELLGRWTILAAGEPRAVDTAVYLTRRLSPEWRAREGLRWMERLVNGRFQAMSNMTLLGTWLTNLRAALNTAELRAVLDETCWHRIIDGLAATGDSTARTLQAADE